MKDNILKTRDIKTMKDKVRQNQRYKENERQSSHHILQTATLARSKEVLNSFHCQSDFPANSSDCDLSLSESTPKTINRYE